MRKDKDSYTTKGKEIPTLREGGFTYSADQKMTNCGGNSPSQKASSKAQSKMSSKASNSMSSRYSQNTDCTDSKRAETKKSGSATDCR